jgi:hypothetical protein
MHGPAPDGAAQRLRRHTGLDDGIDREVGALPTRTGAAGDAAASAAAVGVGHVDAPVGAADRASVDGRAARTNSRAPRARGRATRA